MFRFLFLVLLLGALVYFGTGWLIKWFKSAGKAVKRDEHKAWEEYDKKINPPTSTPVIKKKKKAKK